MGDVRVKWPLLIVLVAIGLVGVAMVVTAPVVWQGISLWLRDATGWVAPELGEDGIGVTAFFGGFCQAVLGFGGVYMAAMGIVEWKVVRSDG